MAKALSVSVVLAIHALTLPGVAYAREGRTETFAIYWENDGTWLKPNDKTDRHYTNGLEFVYTYDPNYRWLKDFARFNDFAKGRSTRTRLGYFFGQNIYTPDHADNPSLRTSEDRVFAGWLYGGLFAQRAAGKEMEHFQLSIGVIGPSARGKEVQDFVHKQVNVARPVGWGAQLSDEFAIDFTWNKRQIIENVTIKPNTNFDCLAEYGFTVGSVHRNANLGVIMRYGVNIPNDFGPSRLDMPASFPSEPQGVHSFYLFGRATARLVEYDRFLTGLAEKPFTGHFQVGLVYRYKSFEVSYSQTFMTKDYDEQPSPDSFAALNLTYYF